MLIFLLEQSLRERSGSVVECLTPDRRAPGSSLTGVTALWSLSKTHYPSLVLVQHRKTRPCLTERLLMGRKESNQTKQEQSLPKQGKYNLIQIVVFPPKTECLSYWDNQEEPKIKPVTLGLQNTIFNLISALWA